MPKSCTVKYLAASTKERKFSASESPCPTDREKIFLVIFWID